jgi:hypothetical protein
MLRRSPLKRSSFKRPMRHEPQVDREPRPMARLNHAPNYAGSVSGVAVQKENASQSEAYMAAVRSLGYCVRCGRTCRPQFCHADQGKGTGIKTDVRRGWAGCGYWSPEDLGCHYIVGTSGELPKAERRAEEDRLAEITRGEVQRRGLWPKSVPMWAEQLGALPVGEMA